MSWPIEIDGQEYQQVPETWIEHGYDRDHGGPRVFAVSVAHDVRNLIRLRYASLDGEVYEVTTPKRENPTGAGMVPASLAKHYTWPRSLVPSRRVDSVDVLRGPETEHMHELWADRVDDLEDGDRADTGRRLVADGGHSLPEHCPNCLATLVEQKGSVRLCYACGADWPAQKPEQYDTGSVEGGESA